MRTKLLIVSIAIIVFLLALPTGAAEPLSLAEYLNLVSQQNLELQLAQVKLERADLLYQRAVAVNLANGSKQATKQAISDYAQAQTVFAQNRGTVLQGAVSAYFQVLLAQQDLEIQGNRLNLVQERREITDRKVGKGIASELELLQATAAVQRAKLDYERAQQTYQEKMLSFNLRAGVSGVPQYGPAQPPIYPIVKYNESIVVEQALENSQQLRRGVEQVELAELAVAKAEAEGVAPLALELAKTELLQAQLEAKLQKQQLRADVQGGLHTLRALEKEIALTQLDIEVEKAKYMTAQKQYTAGLLTDGELTQAVTDLWEAQRRELLAKQNYALQLLKFKELIGEELE